MADRVSFTALLVIFLVVSAIAVPGAAQDRRKCREELQAANCTPAKCKQDCHSAHGKEATGSCVPDEVGSNVSCQCTWFC